MAHTFMTSCLHKLVSVCLAAISLTAFSHRIFKHYCEVIYFTWKYQKIFHFLCICSYLFIFLLSSQFYWDIRLTSTGYFFDPPCIRTWPMPTAWIASWRMHLFVQHGHSLWHETFCNMHMSFCPHLLAIPCMYTNHQGYELCSLVSCFWLTV